MKKRLIAIHLPQFHPFKENDEWWGKGFTEWTNVAKARPRFKGHYQPHIPADLGFYDLRLEDSRIAQAELAKQYGIYGFCYYHYWFNGHQLMERPVKEILSSGKPDFPFMLCWANENWTRNWDGLNKEILIEQVYSENDDKNHIRWLCNNVFSDKRYIRIDGKPVFGIYRIELFPNFKKTVDIWRSIAKEEFGEELYLINAEYPRSPKSDEAIKMGIDSSFNFQPLGWYNYISESKGYRYIRKFSDKFGLNKIPFIKTKIDLLPDLVDYPSYVRKVIEKPLPNYKCYPCVTPSWDNSPRRINKNYMAFINSNPKDFGLWLSSVLRKFVPYSKDENLVFINAWNEWAEGNHLEPDQKWGRAYLEEVKNAISEHDRV